MFRYLILMFFLKMCFNLVGCLPLLEEDRNQNIQYNQDLSKEDDVKPVYLRPQEIVHNPLQRTLNSQKLNESQLNTSSKPYHSNPNTPPEDCRLCLCGDNSNYKPGCNNNCCLNRAEQNTYSIDDNVLKNNNEKIHPVILTKKEVDIIKENDSEKAINNAKSVYELYISGENLELNKSVVKENDSENVNNAKSVGVLDISGENLELNKSVGKENDSENDNNAKSVGVLDISEEKLNFNTNVGKDELVNEHIEETESSQKESDRKEDTKTIIVTGTGNLNKETIKEVKLISWMNSMEYPSNLGRADPYRTVHLYRDWIVVVFVPVIFIFSYYILRKMKHFLSVRRIDYLINGMYDECRPNNLGEVMPLFER